jgi:hypothetical protein
LTNLPQKEETPEVVKVFIADKGPRYRGKRGHSLLTRPMRVRRLAGLEATCWDSGNRKGNERLGERLSKKIHQSNGNGYRYYSPQTRPRRRKFIKLARLAHGRGVLLKPLSVEMLLRWRKVSAKKEPAY